MVLLISQFLKKIKDVNHFLDLKYKMSALSKNVSKSMSKGPLILTECLINDKSALCPVNTTVIFIFLKNSIANSSAPFSADCA